jgi:hypothetical protein
MVTFIRSDFLECSLTVSLVTIQHEPHIARPPGVEGLGLAVGRNVSSLVVDGKISLLAEAHR